MITQNEQSQVFTNGVLQSSTPVVRDITAPSVTFDLHTKARAYLTAADTFLGLTVPTNLDVLAQTRRNTRAICALIRLAGGMGDLLVENTDT